jgi:hypothetical protein
LNERGKEGRKEKEREGRLEKKPVASFFFIFRFPHLPTTTIERASV